MQRPAFNYNPKNLERELRPYYIGTTQEEIKQMLATLRMNKLDDLYAHINQNVQFQASPKILPALGYEQLADHLFELSNKNKKKVSFLGDGLPQYTVTDVVGPVCDIRGLTTAYTPYQPERSQGTLNTLWIYQSLISKITGFEAINASLYDRATCLYEAINAGLRLHGKSKKAIVLNSIYPGDLEVLKTHAMETGLEIITAKTCQQNGVVNLTHLEELLANKDVACVVFPQANNLGNLEPVDAITNLIHAAGAKAIAIIDPVSIANEGLKAPIHFGTKGADIIVGEGQHLAIGPNFGGPGIGIFGIRYNDQDKLSIRSTAGRFIGKTKDLKGRDALALILSTREQHIRREKATSNICSNQSFIASIVGASLLRRGSKGLSDICKKSRENALKAATELSKFKGVKLRFPTSAFFNEFTIEVDKDVNTVLDHAEKAGIQLGVDVSKRVSNGKNLIKLSFSDLQNEKDLQTLINFFQTEFEGKADSVSIPAIPENLTRKDSFTFKSWTKDEVINYYKKLGEANVSPDDGIYPLGSCTMKYNPYINDWAAGLAGFTDIHPESKPEDAQGSLQILFEIQELFKGITGLQGVTTQPVAGAQGELVGLKLFQAYHRDRGEGDTRNVLLIPRSAHGTNPATATMAGFETKTVDGVQYGIVTIEASENGEINFEQLKEVVAREGKRIAGIMCTNPNTAGVFETRFKDMADLIHSVGGLVYMDGANMNAIAGWVDLGKLGVDAVHNNLHKTWTIPHGGGGPGDAIVAVSQKLVDFLPGHQIENDNGFYKPVKSSKSIGSFHRHWGNFAHKIRTYAYIRALGPEGVRQMSAVAVLSAQYLFNRLRKTYPSLPKGADKNPRMHEFILTLPDELFTKIEKEGGVPKAKTIARVGKLFLDFGFHAPTVAFPEVYGLMIEPTESFTKNELDQFSDTVESIFKLINQHPEVLQTVPHFTPIDLVDEVAANKNPVLSEDINETLPAILPDRIAHDRLKKMSANQIIEEILKARA